MKKEDKQLRIDLIANIIGCEEDPKKIIYVDVLNLDEIDLDDLAIMRDVFIEKLENKDVYCDNILSGYSKNVDNMIYIDILKNDEEGIDNILDNVKNSRNGILDHIKISIDEIRKNFLKSKTSKVIFAFGLESDGTPYYGIFDYDTNELLYDYYSLLDLSFFGLLLDQLISDKYVDDTVFSINMIINGKTGLSLIYPIWFKAMYNIFLCDYNEAQCDGEKGLDLFIEKIQSCLYDFFILKDNYVYELKKNDGDKEKIVDTIYVNRKFVEKRFS